MVVNPRQGYHTAGLASQFSEDVNPAPEALITGSYPPLSGMDFEAAAGQDLDALSVVGLDRYGRIVPATYGPPGAFALGTLTISNQAADGNTVTIDGVVYRFSTNVNAANRVAIGADAEACAVNLAAAINGDPSTADLFHADTVAHPTVAATKGAGATVVVQAQQPGVQGNAIATVENSGNTNFANATLIGGVGGIRPIGIAPYEIKTAAGLTPMYPLHLTGVFNPDLLVWDDSFNTEHKRRLAFFGAPSPTDIVIRKIRELTV